MIIDRGHRLLHGCRLFWVGSLGDSPQNLMQLGPPGTNPASGVTMTTGMGGRRRVVFDNTGNNKIVFPNQRNYMRAVRNLTVIFRSKCNGASGGGEPQTNVIISCRKGALATTNAGWAFFYENGFFPNGLNFSMYGGSNNFSRVAEGGISSSGVTTDHVFCGTFNRSNGRQSLYTDGHFVTNATISGVTFNADTDADINIGGISDGDFRLNGEVEWAAVFDRELSAGEIREWSDDSSWPFLKVDSARFTNGPTVRYRNTVSARSILGVGGAANFTTTVSSRNAIGGTISAVDPPTAPAGTVVGRYTTGLGVAGPSNGGTPVLAVYNTRINAASSETNASIVSYDTGVGVASRIRTRADNRIDLIGYGRYRR